VLADTRNEEPVARKRQDTSDLTATSSRNTPKNRSAGGHNYDVLPKSRSAAGALFYMSQVYGDTARICVRCRPYWRFDGMASDSGSTTMISGRRSATKRAEIFNRTYYDQAYPAPFAALEPVVPPSDANAHTRTRNEEQVT